MQIPGTSASAAPVEPLNQVVAALERSAKYGGICSDTLRRVAGWALARHARPAEALKAARRKLHQVYGSYLRQDMRGVACLIERMNPADAADIESTCARVLMAHASTAERMALLPDLYTAIFARAGKPKTVLDLACGLHPFARPWMGLGPEVRYVAMDIDREVIRLVNAFLQRLGCCSSARCSDVLLSPVCEPVDLVFLLKALPCLEQQEKGAAVRLLSSLRARHVVISYPTRSLGGRRKGMYPYYGAAMRQTAGAIGRPFCEILYPGEVFYILDPCK